jgi:REP element-mobilizing transposase RayT
LPQRGTVIQPRVAALRGYPGNIAEENHQPQRGLRRSANPTFRFQRRTEMPQSLSAVAVHLVFSTKLRQPYFTDTVLREELHAVLGGISNRLDCPIIRVGGVEDHVHLLGCLGRTITQADWVKELKRASNVWLKEKHAAFDSFAWQAGYGAFSVSQSNIKTVTKYIDNQVEHHREMSYQDEFRALLKRHGLEWDEQYVWD